MSSKQLILPLYIVHKQAYRINERNLIFLLLFIAISAISVILIFKNLPSNIVVDNKDDIKQFFIPGNTNKNFSKLNAKELIFSNDKETIKKTIKTGEQIPNKTDDPVNKRRDKVKDVISF